MKIITKPSFTASITIGIQIGYSTATYSKEFLINYLQEFQKKQIQERAIYLSAFISEGSIVMNDQIEPHFKLDFINYPKFPLPEKEFKKEIELLTLFLLDKLQQNRIVVAYQDETKMFEKNSTIDPRI